jgi:Ca2+-binding RTX toxin-like protein
MGALKPTNGNDVITLSGNGQTIHTLAGDDTVYGSRGGDRIYGDDGDDTLNGNDGNDFLFGGNGNDTLSGGAGNDDLRGEAGNDALNGGTGNDSLNGGAGADVMTGGAGADHYDYTALTDSSGSNVDHITDFNPAENDDIVFWQFDANADVPGYQGWEYVDQLGAFPTNGNGQATISYDSGTGVTTLQLYNNDGDLNPDFALQMNGQFALGSIHIHNLDGLGRSSEGLLYP